MNLPEGFPVDEWQERAEHQMSGLKAYCEEMFRDAYDGLVLKLTTSRNAAMGDQDAEWYRRWWAANEAMLKALGDASVQEEATQ